MTVDDYQKARKQLGMNVTQWTEKLGISVDTHKSYNSGRKTVSPAVANHIQTLIELQELQNQPGEE